MTRRRVSGMVMNIALLVTSNHVRGDMSGANRTSLPRAHIRVGSAGAPGGYEA